ncbi:MAG: MinD-like ATPase involved in chromosome partitioning or flagellar assembly [Alpinimonas sp.]
MTRVALWVGGSVEDRLATEVVGEGNVLALRATSGFDITNLINAGAVDIVVANAHQASLTSALIDACDIAGVRLIAITRSDTDRRHARSLDFYETCHSDDSWTSMVNLLSAPPLAGQGLPDVSFFDITSDVLPVPVPVPAPVPVPKLNDPRGQTDESVAALSQEGSPLSGTANPQSNPAHTPVVAVWGPTGAPGRTSVAINVAAELTVTGLNVLLIDADPFGGAVATRLGLLDETPGFAAVCRLADQELLTRHELQRLVQHVDLGAVSGAVIGEASGAPRGSFSGARTGKKSTRVPLQVLTGIIRADRWPELSASRVTRALEICRENYDVIVVDVGFSIESDEEISSDLFSPRRNAATLTMLGEADTILAIAESDVLGLARFLRASAEVRELFVGTPFITVANRVRSAATGISPRAQVRQTLERFGGLSDIVCLPHDDRAFDACSLGAAPLCSVAPKSDVRMIVRELAERIAPEKSAPNQSPPGESPKSGSKLFARRRG